MRWNGISALAVAAFLCGCTSDDDFADTAVAQARADCEAQGKEFSLKSHPKVENGPLMQREVEFNADCLGPDDPGYKPPKKPQL